MDFACPQQRLIVEIDGGYHDNVVESGNPADAILLTIRADQIVLPHSWWPLANRRSHS